MNQLRHEAEIEPLRSEMQQETPKVEGDRTIESVHIYFQVCMGRVGGTAGRCGPVVLE